MTTAAQIQTQIDELTARRGELEREYNALIDEQARASEIDTDQARRLPELAAQLQIVGKRLGLLQEDKAEAELDAEVKRYEALTKQAAAYYRWVQTAQEELAALDAKRAALQREMSDREAGTRHILYNRATLHGELIRAGRNDDAMKILNKHKVQGYM
jgi:chromosome segregation ATPase